MMRIAVHGIHLLYNISCSFDQHFFGQAVRIAWVVTNKLLKSLKAIFYTISGCY